MYRKLRIAFCIIAAVLAAACIFIFVYLGVAWGFICLAAAAVCGFLMVFFKRKQEAEEGTPNAEPAEGDFIMGRVTADDAAERIAAMNSAVTVESANGNARTFIIVKGNVDTFDKVGVQSALGKAVWHKKTGDDVTYTDGELKDVTLKIVNIE